MTLLKHYQAEPQQIHREVNALLAPVREYDLAHNSALETTLRCLLQNDMDYKAVADQLFLHKNTVLQRKQKITSLYPEDPFVLPAKKQFEFAFILEALYPL